jgi:hypothetical protein
MIQLNRQGRIYFCRRVHHRQRASTSSRVQYCLFPELGRFWVHSLHNWLIGKRTSGEAFEDKEVSKLREAITV